MRATGAPLSDSEMFPVVPGDRRFVLSRESQVVRVRKHSGGVDLQ